ncbi:helicase HerA-like domain-containing protein [Actinomyces vulturis]|uniref:helicase HerA-like domain-containing protein n=1 Tax=Actinomyces vulturis TaxID=1857645 RepID=UPI00083640FE|nr:helicase HerA-like domain-containing protein [Actinomyces vulturis]
MTDAAEIARLKAAAAQAAAEAAAAQAAAAQAAYEAALAEQGESSDSSDATPAPAAAPTPSSDAPASAEPAAPVQEPAPAAETASADDAPMFEGYAAQVQQGYSFGGAPSMELGCFLDGDEPVGDVKVGIPLSLLNRHCLVAGATGTGKTRTLQLMAENLSAAGVPVFVTDIKGDLTGLAQAGTSNEKLEARAASMKQEWKGASFPVEFLALGGQGTGTAVRTTVTEFGPILLAKVLGLNDTQSSALQLVFHWADQQQLALLDLKDLRKVIEYLTQDEQGKAELKTIGGVSTATAGVILRQLAALEASGGDTFFGEPGFDVADLMRVANDGRGVISSLELPDLGNQGSLFSTFIMWLLAELFETLPEVGNPDKPKLVFFFDEAHLLFTDATKEFLKAVVQTVRLIRSKGVGIVFITQSPTDIPDDVLAQLGSRVQHALRAHTPADAANLKKAVATFPTSPLDLPHVLTSLGTGEAVVSVLDAKGRPTPVAPTKINAPAAVMGPADDVTVAGIVATSPLAARYRDAVDNVSAYELLEQRLEEQERAAAEAAKAEQERKAAEAAQKAAEKEAERQRKAAEKEAERLRREAEKEAQRQAREREREEARRRQATSRIVESTVRSAGTQVARQLTRSILGNLLR